MPLSVFLYAGFFRGLGRDYEEAAAIDGAGPARVFFGIVLPLMAPATGTVSILTGLIVWNDFFTSLIFLGGSDNQTLPVSMYYYIGSLVSAWNKIFAVVIIYHRTKTSGDSLAASGGLTHDVGNYGTA